MALTFTDWEHWTDTETGETGVLDWTSADTLRHAPLRPVVEAIRQAAIERCIVSGTAYTSIPELPKYSPAKYDTVFHPIFGMIWTMGLFFDFVNHIDSGGDWSNTTGWHTWTPAEMLARIGGTIHPPMGGFFPPLSETACDLRAVLNNCVWIQTPQRIWTSTKKKYYYTGIAESYSAAKAKFDALPWDAGEWTIQHYARCTAFSGPNWEFYRGASTVKYLNPGYPTFSNFGLDVYGFLRTHFAGGIYQNNDYPLSQEDKWYRIFSGACSGAFSETEYGKIDNSTMVEPFPLDAFYREWDLILPDAIAKFNVPGGFVFQ